MDADNTRPTLDRLKNTRNPFTEQLRLDAEVLNILAGRRVAHRDQAAIRVADLIGVLQMPQKMQAAKAVNAAGVPTNAEYNALVAQYNLLLRDVSRIHAMLAVTSVALRKRLAGET